jgi:hypothetical protein
VWFNQKNMDRRCEMRIQSALRERKPLAIRASSHPNAVFYARPDAAYLSDIQNVKEPDFMSQIKSNISSELWGLSLNDDKNASIISHEDTKIIVPSSCLRVKYNIV